MFYGREYQLERFDALWRKSVPSFVVCRGRRRIGKSTLVQEFARRSGGCFLKLEGLAPDEHMTNAKQLTAFREQLAAAATGRISSATQRMIPTSWARITTVRAMSSCKASWIRDGWMPRNSSSSLLNDRAMKRWWKTQALAITTPSSNAIRQRSPGEMIRMLPKR